MQPKTDPRAQAMLAQLLASKGQQSMRVVRQTNDAVCATTYYVVYHFQDIWHASELSAWPVSDNLAAGCFHLHGKPTQILLSTHELAKLAMGEVFFARTTAIVELEGSGSSCIEVKIFDNQRAANSFAAKCNRHSLLSSE